MIPTAGQQVGPYEILGRLGRGGMGLVYSAWDSRLHRDVAIKLLREEFINGDSHERFISEARAASGLNHPNICTVFDIGEQDGNPYLVMELLKGETLRARITSGPMSAEEILATGCEIADALGAAHARGIIHRDIKPANIFLVGKPTGGTQAKVLDFGLAKIELADGLDPRYQMTGAGSAVGTVAYMSPEQARGEDLDARSDLFALGIVMYEMATGHVPFEGITSALIFVQLLGHPPHPIREFSPGFPKDLERVILKLLAKERSERYQSARELLDAMRRVDLKQSAGRVSLFSKPSAWIRNSVTGTSTAGKLPVASGEVRPTKEDESSTPSGESLTIRPVKRQPLPPTELPASTAHWVRPPQFSDIEPAVVSPGGQAAAVKPPPTTEPPSIAPPGAGFSVGPNALHKRIWTAAIVALIALPTALVLRSKGIGRPAVMHRAATLMLGPLANHSGDKTLDGIVMQGLRFDLAQSPHLSVPDVVATAGAARSVGVTTLDSASSNDTKRIAVAGNAASFLSGEVRNESGSITVSIQIHSATTGATLLQAEETADSREQIGDAIDRLSAQIRIGLGEAGDQVGRTSVPLTRDATSNIEALGAYAAGVETEASGRPLDALVSLQHAVAVEPKFTQAWLRLADIYGREHAEVAAADAAIHAHEASVGTSDRTRLIAEASYQMHATGDAPRALMFLDQVAASYPLDVSIGAKRALLLREQGEFPEALESAQDVLTRNPYDLEAAEQAEYAMLALDRSEAAVRLEAQIEQHGQHLAVAQYLLAPDGVTTTPAQQNESDQMAAQINHGQMLDATGQLAAGLDAWKAAANAARATPLLASAAAYVLAQGALDRAIASDCVNAIALSNDAAALPRGEAALFAVGMAQGLCGNLEGARSAVLALMAQYPQSFAVKHYYLANLTAIDQIRSDDFDAALATLQPAKQYDLLSLTPYLRGLAHSKAKQWPLAISDFQFVLLHRGATILTSAPVYAMSQLGLSRAYAAAGAAASSAATYTGFLETWKSADASNALVIEAHKHVK